MYTSGSKGGIVRDLSILLPEINVFWKTLQAIPLTHPPPPYALIRKPWANIANIQSRPCLLYLPSLSISHTHKHTHILCFLLSKYMRRNEKLSSRCSLACLYTFYCPLSLTNTEKPTPPLHSTQLQTTLFPHI